MRAPVAGHTGLVKDLGNGAVINTDRSGLAAFRAAKRAEMQKDRRIAELEERVDKLTNLLEKLVNDKPDMV